MAVFKAALLSLSLLCFSGTVFAQDMQGIKEADFSGTWYPQDEFKLRNLIKTYLKENSAFSLGSSKAIAIISPHAGINYSGPAAAAGFSAVQNQNIDTVIVAGFSHSKTYDGIAVFDAKGYKTPLGILYSDEELVKDITAADEKIFTASVPFEQENSIELILPFIQTAFDNPKVLLLAMGAQSFENCQILGDALYEVLKERKNFLIVASTDMSHYLPLPQAEKIDAYSAELITKMQPELLHSECSGKNRMCGLGAVVSVMIASKKLGADKAQIIKLSASSDKPEDEVVGYLSAVFTKNNKESNKEPIMEEEKLLNEGQRKELLKLARDTIAVYLDKKEVLEATTQDPKLKEVMGVFVTLHKKGQLRGCIGNIVGQNPLYIGVRDMAIAAAAHDWRFSPVTQEELDNIDIEISVLSPLKKTTNPEEIVMGKHGVVVKKGSLSGVYLPQVAVETGWGREEFMNSLCTQKAGLPADSWKTGECDIYTFTAEVFGE